MYSSRRKNLLTKIPVSKANGFTLVEVMVAMAIVALSISALLFSTGKQVENSSWLREKILAQWVALNVLQEAQLKARVTDAFPEEKSSGETKLADRPWQWEMQTTATDDKDIMRLDVNIYAGDNSIGDPVATTTGYIDKYYQLKMVSSARNRNRDENNDAFDNNNVDGNNNAEPESAQENQESYPGSESGLPPPNMLENGGMQ
jgi:general secretion pathway protein I